MRAPLLAMALLAAWRVPAAAADCTVPMIDANSAIVPLGDMTATCVGAKLLEGDFGRLRKAAGLSDAGLSFWILDDTTAVNAFYLSPAHVLITRAFIDSLGRDARLMAVAHEIGHAIQDREGTIAWMNEPIETFKKLPDPKPAWRGSAEQAEHLARRRRLEAHADGIAQELLQAAGYVLEVFPRGGAAVLGCQKPEDLDKAPTTHPLEAQRYVNAAITNGAVAGERARAEAARLSSAFDEGPEGEPAAALGFVPNARITDYDAAGRIMPGRRVAAGIRVPPPAPDASPAQRRFNAITAQFVEKYVAAPFREAVNALTAKNRVAPEILEACGTPGVSDFDEDFSVFGWTKRIAEDAALNVVRFGE